MIRVLGDRIAVTPILGTGRIGLIYIPDTTKSSRNQTFGRALVVSVGQAVKTVKVGDTLILSEYFGDEVTVEGQRLRVGRERDVTAIVSGALKTVGDRVLMKREDLATMIGEIFLPELQKVKEFVAVVVAAGEECEVKIGDRVLVPKALAVEVNLEGRRLLLIDERSILAVYE